MKFQFLPLVCFVMLMFAQNTFAWHIIGGEMNYKCLGNNNYEITLRLWRDCNSTTQFDDPATIGIYNANHTLVATLQISFPGSFFISPNVDPCMQLPPGICVEEAIYKKNVNLPNSPGGYDIAYQRCCRNNTIVNIINPQDQGATYTAHIPDASQAVCNSNPYFNNYPPIVICVNQPLVFDHSATDIDGDQLVYSLCTPFTGASPLAPMPVPPPPPPYGNIIWQAPYSQNNQIGGLPQMNIDANTGLLTANPNYIGQYVVGICVSEYRNGVLLDQHVRDFQFNVTTCNPLIVADFTTQFGAPVDTLLVCGNNTIDFNNQSYGTVDFYWDFGVPGINTDVSNASNPTYTYPDTGVYQVMLIAAPSLPCGDTTYKYIEIREGVTADFSFQPECALVPLNFTDHSVPLDGVLSNWNWDFADGNNSSSQNPSHPFSSGGMYDVTLTVENNFGCVSTITHAVEVYPAPNIQAGPDTFICDIDSVMLHAQDGVSYQWSPNYMINNTTVPNPMVQPDFTTTYYVIATNNFGCVNNDSVLVQITDTVIASTPGDTTVCEGQPVQLWASGAVYYRWQPPNGLTDDQISNPVATPSSTTTYYVTSFIGSCFDEDTLTINVLPVPIPDAGPDVTINQGESTQLNGSGGGTYQWSPPDALSNSSIPNPYSNPLNTITYLLTVTGDNGCTATDSVEITVTHIHELYVPNAFSPNGDGVNDFFLFYAKGIRKILSISIFNRWGETIFSERNGNENPWDGLHKSIPCEMGVYVYVIQAETYDGDVIQKKGSLTLLR